MESDVLNAFGLGLNIFGVVLLFKYGLPQPDLQDSTNIALEDYTRMTDGRTAREHRQEKKALWQSFSVVESGGLTLILVGFGLQLTATLLRIFS